MSAVLFIATAQLLMTGILGEYVGRLYEEVKRRPLYIIGDMVNLTQQRGTPEAHGPVATVAQ